MLVAAGSLLSLEVGEEGSLSLPVQGKFSMLCLLSRGGRAPPLSCGQELNLCLSVAWFLPQCGTDSDPLTLGQERPGCCKLV